MSGFTFYAEPTFIVGGEHTEGRYLLIGLGDRDDDGEDRVAIGIGYECASATIELDIEEARRLRDILTECVDDHGGAS
jgi:hypothetical protein